MKWVSFLSNCPKSSSSTWRIWQRAKHQKKVDQSLYRMGQRWPGPNSGGSFQCVLTPNGKVRRVSQDLFSGTQWRTGGNVHKTETKLKIVTNKIKNCYCEVDQAPAQVVWRGCVVSVLRYIKIHLDMVLGNQVYLTLLEIGMDQRCLSAPATL